ncbi:TniQ family protein [Ferdinandcohnia sp. SAFN-114]|uniref:TniQ family protein n=1 Tax=Ferdinandcohnia sp. SAFN-114 TaxID=3387275 RepID=UPI003F7E0B01
MENLLKDLPPRSFLYNLPPIGIRTIQVESMTSYVSRLINAHNLNSGVFFSKIIYPKMGKVDVPRDGIIPKKSCTFNNYHQKSKELVSVLSDLTTINNLEMHTLLDYSNFLANYEVRSNKFWCPFCYQDSNDNNIPVYDKLLWVFNDVELCLEHNFRLICCCPTCKTNQFHISRNNIMGYCFKCGSWLGYSKSNSTENIPTEYFHWQEWTIKNIGDLLSLTKIERRETDRIWASYKDRIKEYISRVTDNYLITSDELFKLAKVPKRAKYDWEKGKRRASLSSLLKLCYVTSTPLKKFLLMDLELEKDLKPLPNFIYSNTLHKTQRKYDIDELRQEIDARLKSRHRLL